MTSTAPITSEGLDDPRDVLDFARWCRSEADRFEANLMVAAAAWADQHPPESIVLAASWSSAAGDTGIPLAGPGAPLVSEFCIAEFAVAIGRSTDSGRVFLATAVEGKYRLPRCWHRMLAGDLQSWRLRRIAEATVTLSMEAAGFVDAQVSAFAHKIGVAQLDRLVEEAKARFMPDQAREDAERSAEGRHVTFHHDQLTFNGTTHIEGELDLADALDLDAAISQGAEQLKVCGSEQSLDVRRALAAGELARRQLALDLMADEDPTTQATATKPRQVVLHVHLSEAAITGSGADLHLARVGNTRTGVTADQVKTWCANPDTAVTVKPVIDLNEHISTNAYEVPKRLEDQTQERDHTCIFPWCTRPAAKCDNEHCIAHADGGTTCSCNIGPMCRRHHRLKTHSAWTYTTLEPGSFLWRSPEGLRFLRDETGTLDVSRDRPERGTHPPEPVAQHFY